MVRSSRQKINMGTEILRNTIEKLDLTLYPQKIRLYILLKSAHGTFSRSDHILGHKTNLNKFKSIFSDQNGMKLQINHRKRNEKKLTTCRLNNMLLKKQWVNEEIKKEIKNT